MLRRAATETNPGAIHRRGGGGALNRLRRILNGYSIPDRWSLFWRRLAPAEISLHRVCAVIQSSLITDCASGVPGMDGSCKPAASTIRPVSA